MPKYVDTTGDRLHDFELDQLWQAITLLQSAPAAVPAQPTVPTSRIVQVPQYSPVLSGNGLFFASDASLPVGNTISNTAVETAFTTTFTVPSAINLVVGSALWLKLPGILTLAAGVQTVQLRLKLNGTTYLASGVVPITGPFSNVGWTVDVFFVFTAIGVSGSAQLYSTFQLGGLLTGFGPVTIDTTASNVFSLTCQFGAGSPSNIAILQLPFMKQIN